MLASFALPADHFLVGQHGAQLGAPVDWSFVLVGESVSVLEPPHGFVAALGHVIGDRQFADRSSSSDPLAAIRSGPLAFGVVPGVEELEKDPLGPAIVVGIGGREFSAPVVAEAEHFQLSAKRCDISIGGFAWGCAGLDGMLFGGQSEGVPAHRVQHLRAGHASVATDDVCGGVAFGMSHVQAVARGIGEHVEDIELVAPLLEWTGAERFVRVPIGLPARFDAGWVVAGHGVSRKGLSESVVT